MAYPLLAAPLGLGGEQALVWGLVVVNLAIVAVGAYFTARLAQRIGAPVQAGYAFAPGVEGATARRRLALVAVPTAVLALWAGYVRWRIHTHASQIEEVTALPFGGYAEAWRLAWRPEHQWGNAFVAAILVVVAVVVVVRWWRRRSLELWRRCPTRCWCRS